MVSVVSFLAQGVILDLRVLLFGFLFQICSNCVAKTTHMTMEVDENFVPSLFQSLIFRTKFRGQNLRSVPFPAGAVRSANWHKETADSIRIVGGRFYIFGVYVLCMTRSLNGHLRFGWFWSGDGALRLVLSRHTGLVRICVQE